MPYKQKDWQLSEYITSTDTDFIVDAGTNGTIIKTLTITNTTQAPITVRIKRTTSSDADITQILPLSSVDAATTAAMDVSSLSLTGGDKLRVYAMAAGIHFDASGADDA